MYVIRFERPHNAEDIDASVLATNEDRLYYVERIKRIALEDRVTLYVDYSHLFTYHQVLAEAVATHYYR
jgi:hypothetical protein